MTLAGRLATNPLAAAKPELSVTLKGPLAAPERTVDVSALLGWLTLRSTELQTRRLQSLETNGNGRQDMAGPVERPGSPAVRFLPLGGMLDSAASTQMPPPRGAGTAERLQPNAPAAVLPDDTRSDLGGTGHGAAAAVALPSPAAPRTDNAATTTGTASPMPRRAGAAALPAVPPPQAPRATAPATRSPLDLLFGSHN
jgi:hypothetical protein